MPLCWPRFIASVSLPRTTQFHIPPTAVVSFLFFIALFLSFLLFFIFDFSPGVQRYNWNWSFLMGRLRSSSSSSSFTIYFIFFPSFFPYSPFLLFVLFFLKEEGGRKKKNFKKKREAEKNPQKKGRKSSVAKQGGTGWYSKLLCTVYTVNYV